MMKVTIDDKEYKKVYQGNPDCMGCTLLDKNDYSCKISTLEYCIDKDNFGKNVYYILQE